MENHGKYVAGDDPKISWSADSGRRREKEKKGERETKREEKEKIKERKREGGCRARGELAEDRMKTNYRRDSSPESEKVSASCS